MLNYGDTEAILGSRTLLGANMAVRRLVLHELGGYATHLGKLRGTLLSGEDHDLCQRVQSAGYEARYLPNARVYHWVPAQRMFVIQYSPHHELKSPPTRRGPPKFRAHDISWYSCVER